MKLTLWDGESDVQGIPARHLRDAYPLPEGGSLALVWSDDETRLLQVQDVLPVGGRVAITPDNLDQLQQLLEEQQNPGTPAPDAPPTREEFDALMTMILEVMS